MASTPPLHAGRGVRWLWALALLALATLAAPGDARAHAALEESDPAPNAIVATAPPAVTMTFTEPLEWSYTRAELYDQRGELVTGATSGPGATDFEMVLALPSSLPNGTYSVLWRTLSTADGHTAQNWFTFTIGSEVDVAAVLEPQGDDASASGWSHAVARWTALLGIAALVAVWPVWMFVVRPGLAPRWRDGRTAVRAVVRFAIAALALATLGNALALIVQASALDGGWPDRILTTLRETRFGELWLMRIAHLLALGLALSFVSWWRPFRRPVAGAVAFAIAFAGPVPFSLISHASAQAEGRGVAIFNDYLHLTAASLWAGGLALMVTVLAMTLRGEPPAVAGRVLATMLPRFSALALTAWVVMALSGLYSAWLHVGSPEALLDTAYGRRLLLKLGLIVPILLLAAFNLVVVSRRVHMRHPGSWVRRFGVAVTTEVSLAVLVLLVVGSLTAQAPARQSVQAESEGVETQVTGDDRSATVTIDPGTAGPNSIDVAFTNPLPVDSEVLLRVEHEDRDTGEKELALATVNARHAAYRGSELGLPGAWALELIVRPPGTFEERLQGEIELESSSHAAHGGTDEGPSWVLGSPLAIAGMVAIVAGTLAAAAGWHRRSRSHGGIAGTW